RRIRLSSESKYSNWYTVAMCAGLCINCRVGAGRAAGVRPHGPKGATTSVQVRARVAAVRISVDLSALFAMHRHEALDVRRRTALEHLLEVAVAEVLAVANRMPRVGRALGEIGRDHGRIEEEALAVLRIVVAAHLLRGLHDALDHIGERAARRLRPP